MALQFKNSNRKPLLLWCSSHTTLSREEIPMFLDAGYRVVPLYTDFWTNEYRKSLEAEICQDWKSTVDLPESIVEKLQSLAICKNNGQDPIDGEALRLLNKYVDAIYMTVLPNLAIKLTEVFDGSVVFRPFGHADLQTYERIAEAYNQPPSKLTSSSNFIWCPILSTLQCAETRPMWTNPVHLGCFVTRSRIETKDWCAEESDPVVLETLPRINRQLYYREIYDQFIRDHGSLPIRILGGNDPKGGHLNDSRILGHLPDQEYHQAIRSSRICIYHGKSPYHVHYHPLEFMAIGVPVLFHSNSAIAWESRFAGYSEEFLFSCGMYSSAAEANTTARKALVSKSFAEELSQSQRFFNETLFSRSKALHQAVWLKTVIISQLNDTRRIVPAPRILCPHDNSDGMGSDGLSCSWGKRVERKIRKTRKKLLSRLRIVF